MAKSADELEYERLNMEAHFRTADPEPADDHESDELRPVVLSQYMDTLTTGVERTMLDAHEAVAARAWFAGICRKDFSAAIRMYTYNDGPTHEVWTLRFGGNAHFFMGDDGESLASLMVTAMRTAREGEGVVD